MLRLLNTNNPENEFEMPFKMITFNGGEPHVQVMKDDRCAIYAIEARIQSFNDLGELLVVCDAIKRMGNYVHAIRIPYFPGARQDRVANSGESFTVKVYADIINQISDYLPIEIVDPHSDVTPALLKNCKLYPIEKIIKKAITDCQPDVIVIPDGGAAKRVEKYMQEISCDLPQIQCLKKRDTKTGKLTGFRVCSTKEELKSKKCLILDDICDAGGTFIGLCEALDALDAGDTYLYVTHGIFSKGYKSLLDNFTKIYTTDSFIPKEVPTQRVKVFNLYGDK